MTFTSAYDGCRKKSTVLTPIPSDAETYIVYIGTDYILYEDRLVENTDTTSLITSIDMLVSTEVGHVE